MPAVSQQSSASTATPQSAREILHRSAVLPCVKSGSSCSASIAAVAHDSVDVIVQQATCAGCNGRCLGQLIGSDNNKSIRVQRQFIETASRNLAVGDSVSISVSRGTLIGLSSLAYLVPVLLMLLFAVVCYGFISRSEPMVACMAATGLAFGLLSCRLATRWYSRNVGPSIRIIPHH